MAEFSYIVLDLEWNQPLDRDSTIREPFFFDSEIIEIGALRLDEQFRETGSFKTFIRPRFYPHMNGDVVRLTKIRAQDLENAPEFPRAYADFTQWCGEDCSGSSATRSCGTTGNAPWSGLWSCCT